MSDIINEYSLGPLGNSGRPFFVAQISRKGGEYSTAYAIGSEKDGKSSGHKEIKEAKSFLEGVVKSAGLLTHDVPEKSGWIDKFNINTDKGKTLEGNE